MSPNGTAQDHSGHAPLLSRSREALTRNPRLKGALLTLLILGLLSGLLAWRYFAVRESTDDAQIDGDIVPVAARVGGTVSAVKVEDNQAVTAGAPLVEIDPRDYQVAFQRARAELADAQAGLTAAESGVPITTTTTESQTSSAAAQVERAQAAVTAAEARLASARAREREAAANDTRAERDLERMQRLVDKDEVSRQQYDLAVASAAASAATLEAARAAVTEAEQNRDSATAGLTQARAQRAAAETGPRQVAVMRARVASARARVELAQAALRQAELNLEYTQVKAPTAGLVSKKSVEPGQVVQPGQPLLALVPLEDVWVTANFKETQLEHMRPGQPVTIRVDAFGRSYRGHVDSIAAATGARFSLLPPENATGNFVKVVQRVPVKIVFDQGQDPEHLLRPGLSVVPTVVTR